MKKTFVISLAAFASLVLSSCGGEPTFDADNQKESINAMAEGLDETKKRQFAGALLLIGLSCGGDDAAVAEALDGKTADEIIEYAKSLADRMK